MRRSSLLLTLLMVSLITIPLLPQAQGAGSDAAKLASVELEVSPSLQGIGGEVELLARAVFHGGCCYHLYSYDVTASLEEVDGLTVVSGPDPEGYDEVDALPGGEPVYISFRWVLRGERAGNYQLTVHIDTSNSGSVEESVNLEITSGCSISAIDVFPQEPEPGDDVFLSVSASPPDDSVELLRATFYYAVVEDDVSLEDVKADNGSLTIAGGQTIDGIMVDALPDEYYHGTWAGSFTCPDEDGRIIIWAVVESTWDDPLTTSSTKVLDRAEDFQEARSQASLVFVLIVVAGVVGTLMMYALAFRWQKRIERQEGERSFQVLAGWSAFDPFPLREYPRWRTWAVVVLILVLLLLSLYLLLATDHAAQLVEFVKEG